MGSVATTFYEAVLARIGAPRTAGNLRACHAWQVAEGGTARYNPWNTTQPEPGTSNYNNFGPHGEYHVRNYPTEAEGVDAIVRTLQNGDYPHIVGSLRAGNDGLSVCHAVDMSVWGTHGAYVTYERIYGVSRPSYRLLHAGCVGSDVRQVQTALNHYGAHLVVDGDFGLLTQKAVDDFEEAHHLAVDGTVGPHVRAALDLPH